MWIIILFDKYRPHFLPTYFSYQGNPFTQPPTRAAK